LSTPDEVAIQAQRLLADPRADETLGDFVAQWLELGTLSSLVKDKNAFPDFNAALASSMQQETLAFTRDVLRGSSRRSPACSLPSIPSWMPRSPSTTESTLTAPVGSTSRACRGLVY